MLPGQNSFDDNKDGFLFVEHLTSEQAIDRHKPKGQIWCMSNAIKSHGTQTPLAIIIPCAEALYL